MAHLIRTGWAPEAVLGDGLAAWPPSQGRTNGCDGGGAQLRECVGGAVGGSHRHEMIRTERHSWVGCLVRL